MAELRQHFNLSSELRKALSGSRVSSFDRNFSPVLQSTLVHPTKTANPEEQALVKLISCLHDFLERQGTAKIARS
ncbi:hypothetical protein LguiA_023162 [Lonicera macranthoides]